MINIDTNLGKILNSGQMIDGNPSTRHARRGAVLQQ
jgi:hypothetical protein